MEILAIFLCVGGGCGGAVRCDVGEPCEADFESAVEHFFNFGRFCSTFGGARGGF